MPVCEPPVPVSLNGCTGHLQGDSIEWIFGAGGKLNGGEKGVVSYSVVID